MTSSLLNQFSINRIKTIIQDFNVNLGICIWDNKCHLPWSFNDIKIDFMNVFKILHIFFISVSINTTSDEINLEATTYKYKITQRENKFKYHIF